MDNQSAKNTGEIIAYIIIGLAAFINIFKYCYSWIKDFFNKDKEKKTASIVINNTSQFDSTSFKDDYRYFLYFLLEQGKILKAMHDMRSDILKEQMDYFDKHVQNIKILITNIIVELLKEADIPEDHYMTYFSNFENFMEMCEGKVKGVFRQMCKDNHFSEYSNNDYRDLVNKNIVIVEGTLKELLRKRYPQKDFIKNFDRVNTTQAVIRHGLQDCFEYARDFSTERETKVKQAKECFEKQVSDIIGMKYSLEI